MYWLRLSFSLNMMLTQHLWQKHDNTLKKSVIREDHSSADNFSCNYNVRWRRPDGAVREMVRKRPRAVIFEGREDPREPQREKQYGNSIKLCSSRWCLRNWTDHCGMNRGSRPIVIVVILIRLFSLYNCHYKQINPNQW